MIVISRKYLIFWWLLVVAYASWIYWLSSQSDIPQPGFWMPPFADKIVHATIYAVFAYVLYRALRFSGAQPWRAAVLALLLAGLYGISDEWHQASVANRTSDIHDWFADVAGASSVFIIARCDKSRAPKKEIARS
jgi:VanZ family protein